MIPWPSRNSRSLRIVICEIRKCRARSLTSTRPSRCRAPRISRRRSSLSRPFEGIMFGLFRKFFDVVSEIKLQRELDLPRRTRSQWKAESTLTQFQRCGLRADCAKLSKQVIHMVEYVEEFCAELETHSLVDRKLFDQRGVPRFVTRALDD